MARVYGKRWKTRRDVPGGGQGDIFVVSDLREEYRGEWILKRLRNPNRLGRFEPEIRALQQLNSPRVPRIVD